MLSKSFKPAKCKTALNLAKSRTKLMKNKKDSQLRLLRREVAQLLQNSQDQSARIRVEHVAREEKMLAAYELIEIYCELIVARLPVIESQKNCPLDLKEAITSLIFAAPRCGDIQELQDIRKHFTAKYGKDFVTAAIELRPACGVSRTMVEKLSVQAPDGPMKVKILKGIAAEHNIQWEPNWFKDEDPMPLGDTPKKQHVDTNNKIQMEPLSVQITDDLEEKHTHGTANLEHSSQKHSRTNVSEIPPSTSCPDIKPSGDVSERISSSQSSRTAKNAFSADGQTYNMEFKDATAAAQAAAESAERASMAARAAAELSIRDSNRRYEGDVLQHKHEQGNPNTNSISQRSPRLEGHQGITNQLGHVSVQRDTRSSNAEHSQSKVNYDTRQQDLRDSESEYDSESENENENENERASYQVKVDSIKQTRDSVSSPKSSKGDYNWSKSSNIHEYETEPSENPFHEETVEPQNQHINNYSQSTGFGGEYDAFSNLKYRSDEIDSDSSFSAFGKGISEVENWQAKSTYVSKSSSIEDEPVFRDFGEGNVFKEPHVKNYGYDSGMDEGPSGSNVNENAGQNVVNAVFDESGSDDDECIFDPAENYKSSSGEISPKHHVLLRKDSPYFDSDLSDSFRNSPIYSKLIEPIPVPFDDDDDEPSPKSEKELQTGNSEPETDSSSYRTPDWDSHVTIGFIRSSLGGEKGTGASFMSNKQLDENQNLHVGSVQEGKKSESESPRSFRLPLQSKDRSEVNSETYSSSDGGMEINLQALPGGRRNKSTWLPPYTRDGFSGNSSPSSKATIKDGIGQSEDSSPTYKLQGSSGRMNNEHVSTPYNATKNSEAVVLQKHVNVSEPSHSGSVPKNVLKTRGKNPIGYSGFDYCVSEEDSPTPVMTKNLQGAGISRRTKGSRTSSRPDETKKSGRFSSTSSVASDSPTRIAETTYSSSEIISQSSRNSDSFSTANADNPETPNSDEIHKQSVSSEKAPPTRGNSGKNPSHVHPKLPDSFEAFTAHLQSLRTNRQ